MRVLGVLISLATIVIILMDGFETILQPRRVTRKYRLARFYYMFTWSFWRAIALQLIPIKRRAAFFASFGPLSLLGLFATWVVGLIFGFALLHWSFATPLQLTSGQPHFGSYLYLSGTTFFTLGYGDITPTSPLGRFLAVGESGLGFGFLAALISYLPALFQAYSRREGSIALLDARAGSPPSAAQLLLRFAQAGNIAAVDPFLGEWERWSAELLESQLSFPILSYYRSQHDNQSWLAALTTILDACSFLMVQVKSAALYQPQVTFAIARHAAVDLALILNASARSDALERLTDADLNTLRQSLLDAGVELHEPTAANARLRELRGMYDPFLQALAHRLSLSLPAVTPKETIADNWQRSAWMRPAPGIGSLPLATGNADHFT
jgi:hypothetical protein